MAARKSPNGERLYLYPHLLFEIFCIVVLVFEAVLFLAVALPTPVLRQVDFAVQFSPKPAWYFLPLYELVKFFPGRLVFLGASVLPLVVLLLLYAVPWIDTSGERSFRKRPVAAFVAMVLVSGVLFLLWRGWRV
jgi:quinol-cytochrome oxidoreductase complex cytochrome b subunit